MVFDGWVWDKKNSKGGKGFKTRKLNPIWKWRRTFKVIDLKIRAVGETAKHMVWEQWWTDRLSWDVNATHV